MTIEDRWLEMLAKVQKAGEGHDKKKTEKMDSALSLEEASQLVTELMASPDSRTVFISKLAQQDDLNVRKNFLQAAVLLVSDPKSFDGWENQQQQELLFNLEQRISKKNTFAERDKLLWKTWVAWCRTKDIRIHDTVGKKLRELAGIQTPNLRTKIVNHAGWKALNKDEQIDLLDAVKGRWSEELQTQAKQFMEQLRLPASSSKPAEVSVELTEEGSSEAQATEQRSTTDTWMETGSKVDSNNESIIPLIDSMNQFLKKCVDYQGQLQSHEKRLTKLEQHYIDPDKVLRLEEKLGDVERQRDDARHRVTELESELYAALDQLELAKQEHEKTNAKLLQIQVQAEQDLHQCQRQAEAAVNAFRAELCRKIQPRIAEAAEPGFPDKAKTPEEKTVRRRLRDIYLILQETEVIPILNN
ncbi:MAG: hypothetical protein JNJ77_01995 [Planctomycetia bacterium]|nr:hypothetical protein [Planctomycetia bacterium]